jgi:hypothetical protein
LRFMICVSSVSICGKNSSPLFLRFFVVNQLIRVIRGFRFPLFAPSMLGVNPDIRCRGKCWLLNVSLFHPSPRATLFLAPSSICYLLSSLPALCLRGFRFPLSAFRFFFGYVVSAASQSFQTGS